jgi:hypothetical protein
VTNKRQHKAQQPRIITSLDLEKCFKHQQNQNDSKSKREKNYYKFKNIRKPFMFQSMVIDFRGKKRRRRENPISYQLTEKGFHLNIQKDKNFDHEKFSYPK